MPGYSPKRIPQSDSDHCRLEVMKCLSPPSPTLSQPSSER